jgi:hypothetical protein
MQLHGIRNSSMLIGTASAPAGQEIPGGKGPATTEQYESLDNFLSEETTQGAINDYEFIARGKRTRADHASINFVLEGGYSYKIVPTSFALLQELNTFPRKGNMVISANHAVAIRKKKSSWDLIGHALHCTIDQEAKKKHRDPHNPDLYTKTFEIKWDVR